MPVFIASSSSTVGQENRKPAASAARTPRGGTATAIGVMIEVAIAAILGRRSPRDSPVRRDAMEPDEAFRMRVEGLQPARERDDPGDCLSAFRCGRDQRQAYAVLPRVLAAGIARNETAGDDRDVLLG